MSILYNTNIRKNFYFREQLYLKFKVSLGSFLRAGSSRGTKAGRKVAESELTIKFYRYSSAQTVFTLQQSSHRTAFPFYEQAGASFQFLLQLCNNYNRALFTNMLIDEKGVGRPLPIIHVFRLVIFASTNWIINAITATYRLR